MRSKLYNAFEGAGALIISAFIAPNLEKAFPLVPLWVWLIVSVLLTYILVAILSLVLWQRPRIDVEWKWNQPGTPALENLQIELNRASLASNVLEVSFSGKPKGYITRWIVGRLRRKNLRLEFEAQGAPAYVVMMRSSSDPQRQSLGATAYGMGFQMRVATEPHEQTWMWAQVNFQAQALMNGPKFPAVYAAAADGKFPNWLARHLIAVRSRTETITFF